MNERQGFGLIKMLNIFCLQLKFHVFFAINVNEIYLYILRHPLIRHFIDLTLNNKARLHEVYSHTTV